MFFGLTNSPATFQRFMNNSFHNMITEGWLIIYMDDLLIYFPDPTTHMECTKQVLQYMVELNLHLKLKKCMFTTTKVEYLGIIVKLGQLTMDPVKLNGIAHWPTPSKVKDAYLFLGFANFYWQIIPNYSIIAYSLINLTKKNLPWNLTPSQQLTFDSLKHLFLSEPVLYIPDFSSLFAIATDASKYALGAILLQTDSNGEWHPCSYLSQSFSPVKHNYDIYDYELLAVIPALKTWQHYLHGSPFPIQVFTNHKNLTYFCKAQALNCQQAHWLLDLADFNLIMIHVPESHLTGSDTLFHCPDLLLSSTPENKDVTLLFPLLFINLIDMSLSHHIQSSSTSDPLVLQALQSMDGSIPLAFWSHLSNWQHTEGILIYKGCVYVLSNLPLCKAILACCHDHRTTGHSGYLKTCQLVASEFWWPGLVAFVQKYIEGCTVCQKNKSNMHPTILLLTPICSITTCPFQQISCNLITDLPPSIGFDSLLVVVDHGLTKGVILCPRRKLSLQKELQFFFS